MDELDGVKDQFLKLGVFRLGEKEPKSDFGRILGSEDFRSWKKITGYSGAIADRETQH